MAFKFVALFTVLAVASAGVVPVQELHTSYHEPAQIAYHQQQPALLKTISQPTIVKTIAQPTIVKTIGQPTLVKQVEYHDDHNAQYDFSYGVHDEHTGDIKEQHETRNGDQVHGQYSLIDSDGHKRTVEYTADDHNGFNAVVHREPTDIRIPQPVQKIAIAQPTKIISAQPTYIASAPVAQYHAAAPVTQYHAAAPVAQYHTAAPAAVIKTAGLSHY